MFYCETLKVAHPGLAELGFPANRVRTSGTGLRFPPALSTPAVGACIRLLRVYRLPSP